ncbi:MAG: bifunctional oligoribonuclease/PAP phosphatase NrnA [bacterium]|nr:bifunctional oligoribonuclease/PAP phosphatase NrnA [bacterium]MBU1916707.1 bifunctional oligoribonuclease/PAP phosphatase NrnA [bacterium]
MRQATKISQNKLLSLMGKAKSVLLTTHENPDGDGLGSIIALGLALRAKGKKIYLFSKDPVPVNYQFLPNQKLIKNTLKTKIKFDLTLLVDVGEMERVGSCVQEYPHKGLTISIDHHAASQHNTQMVYCLPKESSSGEIVLALLKKMKTKMTQTIATNLYTAIATDTGAFKYSNTTQKTFQNAAYLCRFGVDVWDVALNCFETYTPARMNLLKKAIGSINIHANKKVAWIILEAKDFKATKTSSQDAEGFINYPRAIDGVEVALFFKEKSSRCYKISMRSKKYVNVAKIAAKFGGGGHVRASGCTLNGTLSTVRDKILQTIVPLLKS